MESVKRPYFPILFLHFLGASFLFFVGVAISLASPGGAPEPLWQNLASVLIFTLPALLISLRIAWILKGLESLPSYARHLPWTIPLSLVGVFLGALLISLAIFREHWSEVFLNR